MDEPDYLRLIRGEARGPLAGVARLGLGLASGPYGVAVRARNLAFEWGGKTSHRAAVPVVSVGNITVGDCARIAAGSAVLRDVPARTTVAGVPAKVVGLAGCPEPARAMNQLFGSIGSDSEEPAE